MASPKGKPGKPKAEAFKDVSMGQDGVYRVSAAEEAAAQAATAAESVSSAAASAGEAAKSAVSAAGASDAGASKASGGSAAGGASSSTSTPSSFSSASGGSSSGGSSSGGGSGVKTALTAGAALAAGALLAFWLGPKIGGAGETDQRVTELTQRVALFDGQANALQEAAGRVEALDARVESMAGGLSALETNFAGLPQSDEAGPRLAALTERLEGLEKALASLSEQQAAVVTSVNAASAAAPSGETASRLEAVETGLERLRSGGIARMNDVESRLTALAEAPAPAPVLPPEADSRISGLEARVSSLADGIAAALAARANGAEDEAEQALAAAAPSAESLRAAADASAALASVQGLESRLSGFDAGALETQIAQLRARLEELRDAEPAPAASPEELAALAARLDELSARQEAAAEAPPAVTAADLEGLAARTDLEGLASQTDLEGLASREDLADLATRAEFDGLSARMDGLAGDVAAAVAVRTEAAAAVAAADLQNVASGSAPFHVQLANLQRISGVAPDPALAIYARTGTPTLASLLSGFPEAERAALRAEQEARAREAEDVGGKLTGALSSLVAVRRAAESGGVDTASILARARARLNEGDLASALAELELLQSAPRAGMAAWLEGAQNRRNVEESLGRLRQNLLTAPGPQ